MILAIDIGNTDVTLGLFRGKRLVRSFRVSSETRRTPDEVALLLKQVFPEAKSKRFEGVVLASVVPPQTPLYAEAARAVTGKAPLEVGARSAHGLAIEYHDPTAVGADRIANAVGAFERYKAPAIVVDFGTATTFDVLLTGRRYRGGVIVPGVMTGAEQLIRRAARLGAFELKPPARVVGRTTEESLQSGVFYGAVGQVDSIVRLIAKEERIRPIVIATGGLASAIAAHSTTIDLVDLDLTLHGLLALHARQRARAGGRGAKSKPNKK
ncbi:MAG TPA: type III pantothenate kinase [Candidatus Eisenbacteria bacterium]|nr:type III pantothenate kinase [Candidatus Eisenbacteria bacterium]